MRAFLLKDLKHGSCFQIIELHVSAQWISYIPVRMISKKIPWEWIISLPVLSTEFLCRDQISESNHVKKNNKFLEAPDQYVLCMK